jgi:hypothetical protein
MKAKGAKRGIPLGRLWSRKALRCSPMKRASYRVNGWQRWQGKSID